jgi:hypothetical protein
MRDIPATSLAATLRPRLPAVVAMLLATLAVPVLLPGASPVGRPGRRIFRPAGGAESPTLPESGRPFRKAITTLDDDPQTEHERGVRAPATDEPRLAPGTPSSSASVRPTLPLPAAIAAPIYLTLLILLV